MFCTYVVLDALLMGVNSDRVWGQTIMYLRGRYGPLSIQSSPDNFFLKYPLYIVANHVFGPGRGAIVAEIVVMDVVMFAALAAAYLLLVRYQVLERAGGGLLFLVGLWMTTTVDPVGEVVQPFGLPWATFVNPNERNLELGLTILVLVVAGLMYLGPMAAGRSLVWRLVAGAGLAAAAAMLCYDDPYNVYILLAPLALVAVARAALSRRPRVWFREQHWQLWYFLGLSGLLLLAVGRVAAHYGLHPYSSSQLGRITILPASKIVAALHGTLTAAESIWNGGYAGQPAPAGPVHLILNAIAGLTLIACALTALRGWGRTRNLALALLPSAMLVMAVIYLVTGDALEPWLSRYLIICFPVCALVAPAALARMGRSRRTRPVAALVCALLVVAVAANLTFTISNAGSAVTVADQRHANLQAHVDAIRAAGVAKGYADYWDGNITTYLTHGKRLTIPVMCDGGQLRVRHWNMDDAWLRKPATRSFLLVDRAVGHEPCDHLELREQFGSPVRQVRVGHGQHLLVFDYDILSRMPKRPDPNRP